MPESRKPRVIADVPEGFERVRVRQRAYVTNGQRKAAAKLFGCIRVVQNDAMAYAHELYKAGQKYPGRTAVQHHVLTLGKKRPERAFLGEVAGVALIQALNDTHQARVNFFDSRNGKRKGARMGFPKRKKRTARGSARFSTAARFHVTPDPIDSDWALVNLTGLGNIRFRLTQPIEQLDAATSVTLIREADGRFHLSFVVLRPLPEQAATAPTGMTGLDVGLKSFATTLTRHTDPTQDQSGTRESVGQIETPAYLRRRARALARSQRALSRKQKGSKNRLKAKQRVAVHHRKVRDARLDHAHQHAARLVSSNTVIAVEDLHVKGMARGRSAKSVHDQAMAQFLRILAEKAARHGVTLVKVGRYFPSTQLCSNCHHLTGPKGQHELDVRTWTCSNCAVTHDRDINAARNILTEGLRLLTLRAQATGTEPGQQDPSQHHVADGQSETKNASPRNRKTRALAHAGTATPTTGEDAGRTTGAQAHAAA